MTHVSDVQQARSEERMRRYRYNKMPPADISIALDKAGLSVGKFSRIIGARYNGPNDSTVQKWIDGKQDAPTWLPAFFELLTMPGAIERAWKAAERYIVEEGSP